MNVTLVNNKVATEDQLKLPQDYAPSLGSDTDLIPEGDDSIYDAIAKLHKAILEVEEICAMAFNDINNRLNALEG